MRTVVVGGAGFIGINLVDRLIDDGHEVIIIDDLSTGKKENINEKAIWNEMDIGNPYSVDYMVNIMKDVDVVFHLAARARVQPSIEDPISFNKTNVDGTLHLLEACRKAGVKRFVYSSSSSVYGDAEQIPTTEECTLNPISPYALQKLVGEQYCKLYSKLHDMETVCLRYFNVYGKRQPTEGAYCLVMGVFAGQRLRGEPMTIRGDGEQRRDFTHVDDVVQANMLVSTNDEIFDGKIKCRAFNIGNGDNRSINDIADMIGGDRVNVEPVIEPKETLANNSLAEELLGWKPTQNIEDWVPGYKKEMGLDV